jgi:hypothetical protein
MTVYISKKASRNFTQIPNTWLRDPDMTLKARGLLAYIYSHAEGYRLTTEQMIHETASGRDAIKAALRELEELGYLARSRERGGHGRFVGIEYILCDDCGMPPHHGLWRDHHKPPSTDFPPMENPQLRTPP